MRVAQRMYAVHNIQMELITAFLWRKRKWKEEKKIKKYGSKQQQAVPPFRSEKKVSENENESAWSECENGNNNKSESEDKSKNKKESGNGVKVKIQVKQVEMYPGSQRF